MINVELLADKAFLEISLDRIEMPQRCQNAVKRMGYETIGDVVDNWNALSKIRNMGQNSVNALRNAIIDEMLTHMSEEQIRNWVYGLVINNTVEDLVPFFKRLQTA